MRRWLSRKVRNRVVVYTTDGRTFEGVLDAESADGLVLIVASLNGQQLPGQLFFPREQVSFVQLPPVDVLR